MKFPTDRGLGRVRGGELGASRAGFIALMAVLVAAGYVAYRVVPVMYNASLYKVYMQDTVDKAIATGKDQNWVREQLGAVAAEDYGLPPTTRVETQLQEGRMVVRVRWTRPLEFPGYTYQYNFDHTVRSAKFLSS